MRCLAVFVFSCAALFGASAHQAAAQSWTGAYAGVHAGYRWADLDLTTPPYQFMSGGATFQVPARNESFSIEGALAGLHGGYNLMIAPSILFGVEADISFTGGDSNRAASFSAPGIVCEVENECEIFPDINASRVTSIDLDWQATIRARLGYTTGSTLFYTTAGVAFMNVDWTETMTLPAGQSSVSKEETITGFAVGGGVETFLSSNLIGRIEYLYEDFESLSVPLVLTPQTGDLDLTAHKLRVGLSYKF